MKLKVIFFALLCLAVISGCEKEPPLPLRDDEGVNGASISRVFQSNPAINEVQIRTPLTEEAAGKIFMKKVLVFHRKIGADKEYFELDLNSRINVSLDNANKNRIGIKFENGKVFSFDNNSRKALSMVLELIKGSDGIGRINGILSGPKDNNKDLINHLKTKKVTSFSLEGMKTEVTKAESEVFLKDVNSVIEMN